MPTSSIQKNKIAGFWDRKGHTSNAEKTRFWQSPTIVSYINARICGQPTTGLMRGIISRINNTYGNRVFKRGVSVGCGEAIKEARLIKDGLVESFDLFELSTSRINKGEQIAKKMGLTDRMHFCKNDPFAAPVFEHYDFCFWNASLHHMMDVNQAILWSRDVLKQGGLFCMNEYIGPNHLQFTDQMLTTASYIRSILPSHYLTRPNHPNKLFPTECKRPDIHAIINNDPSEAADSSRILGCVKDVFPDVEIILTGGIVYFIALADIISNFDERNNDDVKLLKLLLTIDSLLADMGHSLRACAFATK